jgi:hypothetical protein
MDHIDLESGDMKMGMDISQVMSPMNVDNDDNDMQFIFAAESSGDKRKIVSFNPLDTSKAVSYQNWRWTVISEMKAIMDFEKSDNSDGYVNMLESGTFEVLKYNRYITDRSIMKIDHILFNALIKALRGIYAETLLEKIRTMVPIGHGLRALQILDEFFIKDVERVKMIAMNNLIGLEVSGMRPENFFRFITRFRQLRHIIGNDSFKRIAIECIEENCINKSVDCSLGNMESKCEIS